MTSRPGDAVFVTDLYPRIKDPLPICMYCWKPLVKFLPPSNYKGPPSEWTHFQRLTPEKTFMSVLCRSKQHGPRVPKMIPGRLVIEEIESQLVSSLNE